MRDSQNQVLTLLKEATSDGPLTNRMQAALSWVRTAVTWSDPSSLDAYRTSLGLLQTLLESGSSLESRHLRLTSGTVLGTQSLVVDAAACAISLGHIPLALEMLEQGRNVLLTQAGRYRTRVDDLEYIDPRLADEFKMISAQMDASAMKVERLNTDGASVWTSEDAVAR